MNVKFVIVIVALVNISTARSIQKRQVQIPLDILSLGSTIFGKGPGGLGNSLSLGKDPSNVGLRSNYNFFGNGPTIDTQFGKGGINTRGDLQGQGQPIFGGGSNTDWSKFGRR